MDEIGTAALKRNSKLELLSPFIGAWRTTGTHPLMPGQALEGRTSFAWHQGGAFVIMHSEMRQPEVPAGVAIFGSDDDGSVMMIYFDRRGVSRHYRVELGAREMRWMRDDARISQRINFTVSRDGGEIRQVGQMSRQGGPWQEDLTLVFQRLAHGRPDARPPG
jgi:hypothetical protein